MAFTQNSALWLKIALVGAGRGTGKVYCSPGLCRVAWDELLLSSG